MKDSSFLQLSNLGVTWIKGISAKVNSSYVKNLINIDVSVPSTLEPLATSNVTCTSTFIACFTNASDR